MGLPFNGDLVPVASGWANLGVEVSSNAQNAFDITELRPFNHVHMISGVFHDPIMGQSGIIRFNRQQAAFQVSVDGGLTFNNISAGSAVDSIGQLGGADLTGNVDLATASSGFMTILDTAGASPLLFAVDNQGLSGLWRFPAQGFNGSVVNKLTDFNGTTAQGVIQVVGISGIIADIVGQTLTISPGFGGGFTTIYKQDFDTPATTWTIQHNLNSFNVNVQLWNGGATPNTVTPKRWLIPDRISVSDLNQVVATFNVAQSGQAIVVATPGQ